MAKKKPSLSSAVVAFMSDDTQARFETTEPQSLLLPVDSILPDPDQPRQLLPENLREALIAGETSRRDTLQAWIQGADLPTATPALHHNVRELKRLADSIAQHGLISPISVRQARPDESLPAGIEYLIVTGERRYWAQIYLLTEGREIKEGDTTASPDQIKATVAASGITISAHQLIENLMREDLNAIERAGGLWVLRYELSGVNDSSPSAETETGIDMVNDSSPSLVPWARVEEALGISKRYRIFVTSVLNLSPEAQEIVKAHNLAEMTIRPIVQKLRDKPDLQLKALNQLVEWIAENEAEEGKNRAIVASVKELVDKLLADEAKPAADPIKQRAVSSAPVVRFHNKVRQTLEFLNRLKSRDRSGLTDALGRDEFVEVMLDLRNLRQQIDDILETVTEAHPPASEMNPPVESESESD